MRVFPERCPPSAPGLRDRRPRLSSLRRPHTDPRRHPSARCRRGNSRLSRTRLPGTTSARGRGRAANRLIPPKSACARRREGSGSRAASRRGGRAAACRGAGARPRARRPAPARVARGGRDPEVLERSLAQDPAVADAVQRDAAGEHEVPAPRDPVRVAGAGRGNFTPKHAVRPRDRPHHLSAEREAHHSEVRKSPCRHGARRSRRETLLTPRASPAPLP